MRKKNLNPAFLLHKTLGIRHLSSMSPQKGKSWAQDPQHYVQLWMTISRFLLWLLTAILYLSGPPSSMIGVKIGVIAALGFEAVLATQLYQDTRDRSFILVVSIAETLGIILLILITGGLDSPFVWYALNPILAAAVFLPFIYSWLNLLVFISIAIAASTLYPGIQVPFFYYLYVHLDLLLVFFFLTLLYQICASLISRLSVANKKLSEAQALTEKALLYVSSFEEALQAFSAQQDRDQLAGVLSQYASILGGYPAVCMLESIGLHCSEHKESCVRFSEDYSTISKSTWENGMKYLRDNDLVSRGLLSTEVDGLEGQMLSVPIKSCGEAFGSLACMGVPPKSKEHVSRWLQLMADLGAIALERQKSDEIWGRFLVSEEQNRIANEIHDGVIQYLFSTVCALHKLSQECVSLQDESVQEQLKLIQATVQKVSRELRASIYDISPYKRGESVFVEGLAAYLEKLGCLNGIQVHLFTEGDENGLDSYRCKSLNRIIREASSNAIRHGNCHTLTIRLNMSPAETVLEIEDDGCGYQENPDLSQDREPGLGIHNIQQIVHSYNGELEIAGTANRSTVLKCTLPGRHLHVVREEGVS